MKKWQLQEAKAKFSKVVKSAIIQGPQGVTKHGLDKVVIISADTYDSLTKSKNSFVSFIQSSPLVHLN